MKISKITMLFALFTFAVAAMAGDENSHWQKAYPNAEAGFIRHVLHLTALADESTAKVELIVGKMVETDGANHYAFSGKIQEQDIDGWGYPRYNVTAGPLISTMMAPTPGTPKVNKFVAISGEPYLVRYNSKLPVVVYAPDGFEVRYRIWKAGAEIKTVDKG